MMVGGNVSDEQLRVLVERTIIQGDLVKKLMFNSRIKMGRYPMRSSNF